ncbi:MAG: 4-hydroxy-tetrahydrodipicolinate synthase, partial [Candidatus Omnitrophica bacterium]|nr:4-hydroxy-tetrahydrodipicolinate synthase [Candidatus Omnitrophota bacterium]
SSATLTEEEHEYVIEAVIEESRGRIPVIAGTGSNSTQEAIVYTKFAQKKKANAALLICPYYNKPTQEGLFQHFKAIAQEVDLPLILYNIPSRTGVNMQPETIARLAQKFKNIVGIKEATGSLDQMTAIKDLCPRDFLLISGDDAITLPILSIGGVGVISVLANIMPQEVEDLVRSFEAKDIKKAERLHVSLYSIIKMLFIETNPAPVKTAMNLMGMISDEVRLPLVKVCSENRNKIASVIKRYGLIT